jgi:hypothetical protein
VVVVKVKMTIIDDEREKGKKKIWKREKGGKEMRKRLAGFAFQMTRKTFMFWDP